MEGTKNNSFGRARTVDDAQCVQPLQHASIIASSLRTQSVVHNIAENQKRSIVKVVLEICSTSLKLSYALRQGNVLCRLCTYVCTCSCVCISLSVCVCVCMCMYVYVYVYVYVFVLETAARNKKKMTPLWKVTSIFIFHSAGQHSYKRWNWRST